jgi:hypothetical protein
MRTKILLLIFSVLCCGGLCAQASERISCADRISSVVSRYYPGYSVVGTKDLDRDVQDYLREEHRDSDPGCIEEDFDGDGLQDYAVLIQRKERAKTVERLVALRGAEGDNFVPITLDTFRDRIGSFFILPVRARNSMKQTRNSRPRFKLVLFESASRVYLWKGNSFTTIQTSD